MARKHQLLRKLTVRVKIPHLTLVEQWAERDQSSVSTVVRDLIERERLRLAAADITVAAVAA